MKIECTYSPNDYLVLDLSPEHQISVTVMDSTGFELPGEATVILAPLDARRMAYEILRLTGGF